MKKLKLRKNVKFSIIYLTIVLFLCTFTITNSRYIGMTNINNDIIAVPVFELDNNEVFYDINNLIPGGEYTYNFQVSNTKDKNTNEVLLSYIFNFKLGVDIPITYELYDKTNNKKVTLYKKEYTDKELQEMGSKNSRYYYYTDEQTLEYGKKDTIDYELKIAWKETQDNRGNYNDAKYAGLKTTLNVTLKATQVV